MLAAWTLVSLSALAPLDAEWVATRHVVQDFEAAGREPPQGDAALSEAARAVAQEALKPELSDATDQLTIAEHVSRAGGFDASPRALVFRGLPAEEALLALEARSDFGQRPATHLGVGLATDGSRAAIAVLLSQRKVLLEPFPRKVRALGQSAELCGALLPPLGDPEVFLELPSGQVKKLSRRLAGNRFCATVTLPQPGRYALEVVGIGPMGPDVAAVLFVQVGPPALASVRSRPLEPATEDAARRAVGERINALRAAYGAGRVEPNPLLDRVAQSYAEQMSRRGFFAHVSPEGQTLRARLHRTGYEFEVAAENLGFASGPLAAAFAIEQSPAHREQLLEPRFSQLGVGVVFERDGGRSQALVVEVFTRPLRGEPRVTFDVMKLPEPYLFDRAGKPWRTGAPVDVETAYQRLRELRAAKRLPPLARNSALEMLALQRAGAADQPPSPEERAFAQQRRLELLRAGQVTATTPSELAVPEFGDAPAGATVGLSLEERDDRWVLTWVLAAPTP